MRASSNFLRRLARIEQELHRLEADLSIANARSAFNFNLICLQSRWEQFLRDYLLEHLASDRFGSSHPRRAEKNAALAIDLLSRGASREPNWAVPSEAISFCTRMRLTAGGRIVPTLGATPWILDGLRLHRNFLAHMSEEAAKKLRRYSGLTEADDLYEYAVGYDGGAVRYRNWIGRMKTVIAMLP